MTMLSYINFRAYKALNKKKKQTLGERITAAFDNILVNKKQVERWVNNLLNHVLDTDALREVGLSKVQKICVRAVFSPKSNSDHRDTVAYHSYRTKYLKDMKEWCYRLTDEEKRSLLDKYEKGSDVIIDYCLALDLASKKKRELLEIKLEYEKKNLEHVYGYGYMYTNQQVQDLLEGLNLKVDQDKSKPTRKLLNINKNESQPARKLLKEKIKKAIDSQKEDTKKLINNLENQIKELT